MITLVQFGSCDGHLSIFRAFGVLLWHAQAQERPRVQICVKFRVNDRLSVRGPDGVKDIILKHEPCWVFLKHHGGKTPSSDEYGGWRLCARLKDQSVPVTTVGAEVKAQIPDASITAKLTEGWEAQRVAMQVDRSVAGYTAQFLLFRWVDVRDSVWRKLTSFVKQ
jgi:hypothetical protein